MNQVIVHDYILSPETLCPIFRKFNACDVRMSPQAYNLSKYGDLRKSLTYPLDIPALTKLIGDAVSPLARFGSSISDKIFMAKYNSGDGFKPHRDDIQFNPHRATYYTHSFLIGLSDIGSTSFYNDQGEKIGTVENKINRLILFPTQLMHSGNLVKDGEIKKILIGNISRKIPGLQTVHTQVHNLSREYVIVDILSQRSIHPDFNFLYEYLRQMEYTLYKAYMKYIRENYSTKTSSIFQSAPDGCYLAN